MSPTPLTAVWLVLIWWVGWAIYYRTRVARRSGRHPVTLVAYELGVLALTAITLVLMLAHVVVVPLPPMRVPVVVALLVGLVCGSVTWAILTGFSGIGRMRPPRTTRRLGVGLTLVWISAVGEEVAFRLLLFSAITETWDAWHAWIITAVAFGLHHLAVGGLRVALLHVGSALVFGGLVLAGFGVAAAIAAHLAYNTCAALVREGELQAGIPTGASTRRNRWV